MSARRTLLVCGAVFCAACGPGQPATEPESGEGSGGLFATTGVDGATETVSTGPLEECAQEIAERVTVTTRAEAAAYADVRRFDDGLRIEEWPEESLIGAFPCLEEIGGFGLTVRDSPAILTLEGLEGLRVVDFSIQVVGNAELESLEGLDGVEELMRLDVARNPRLTDMSLPRVKELPSLNVGWCDADPKVAFGFSNGIEELTGFGSLERIGDITVVGQTELRSLSALRRVLALPNGAIGGNYFIQHNPSLPISEVEEVGSLVPNIDLYSCGNLDESDEAVCNCPIE